MADPITEPTIIAKAIEWIWAVILGTVGVLWKANDKKIEDMQKSLQMMASDDDLSALSADVKQLFLNAERDRGYTRDLHDKSMEAMREQHRELVGMLTNRLHDRGGK